MCRTVSGNCWMPESCATWVLLLLHGAFPDVTITLVIRRKTLYHVQRRDALHDDVRAYPSKKLGRKDMSVEEKRKWTNVLFDEEFVLRFILIIDQLSEKLAAIRHSILSPDLRSRLPTILNDNKTFIADHSIPQKRNRLRKFGSIQGLNCQQISSQEDQRGVNTVAPLENHLCLTAVSIWLCSVC
ncbi:hypothetical protein CEXT_139331 [Caerostris extrusa]|uniref:Uncharacterized protein n=1 Tax=Caerostris extrusa TaxID=172846 RepID=A0AAV4Y0P5_CAEEX|nr:hypothetical protein CEXT_139331 [Caerostris extrusa]